MKQTAPDPVIAAVLAELLEVQAQALAVLAAAVADCGDRAAFGRALRQQAAKATAETRHPTLARLLARSLRDFADDGS